MSKDQYVSFFKNPSLPFNILKTFRASHFPSNHKHLALECKWEKERVVQSVLPPFPFTRQQETSGWRTESSERTHPQLGWTEQCLAQTVHLESGHPTVTLLNPVQVLHFYQDFAAFSKECVGVVCCRVLAVLCKVCNFLAPSGVKGIIFPSAFRCGQAETVFPEHLILCFLMFSGLVSQIFRSLHFSVLFRLKNNQHFFFISTDLVGDHSRVCHFSFFRRWAPAFRGNYTQIACVFFSTSLIPCEYVVQVRPPELDLWIHVG